jgi:phosphoserine phosphatase RsbU/P
MSDARGTSLAVRLVLAFTACSATIFLVVFSANYFMAQAMVRKNAERHAADVVNTVVARIQAELVAVTNVPTAIASLLEKQEVERDRLRAMLREFVIRDKQVFGATAAFEPESAGGREFAPYVFEAPDGKVAERDLATGDYDYRTRDWYAGVVAAGVPRWSEPYFDKGGGDIAMTTFATPFFRQRDGERRFAGVVTADVSLDWLARYVSSLTVSQGGFVVLYTESGRFITSTATSAGVRDAVVGVVRPAAGATIRGFQVVRTGWFSESWVYHDRVPASAWQLAVVFPAHDMLGDVQRLGVITVVLCLGGFGALLAGIIVVSRSVTRPLISMTAAAQAVAKGELDTELPPVAGRDELARLAQAFGQMQGDLKQHIAALTEATAARERVESELDVARGIQAGMLPTPLTNDGPRHWQVAARMRPARHVGGDLYDFVAIDDDRLFFCVGDVSGKGVPASLYMAVTLALGRRAVYAGAGSAAILDQINAELARNNELSMFVTMACGILDGRTGEVVMASAGHQAPLRVSREGVVEDTKVESGLVAGFLPTITYTPVTLTLAHGDALVLVTDGVTEAFGPTGEMFGSHRFATSLADGGQAPLETVVDRVFAAVDTFAATTPQSDDITVLAVRYV